MTICVAEQAEGVGQLLKKTIPAVFPSIEFSAILTGSKDVPFVDAKYMIAAQFVVPGMKLNLFLVIADAALAVTRTP
jgi:hypothetical protein